MAYEKRECVSVNCHAIIGVVSGQLWLKWLEGKEQYCDKCREGIARREWEKEESIAVRKLRTIKRKGGK